MKDVLTFDSDAFSLEPPVNEDGVAYDLPLGDDIAAYFKTQIEADQPNWHSVDTTREDFGSVLSLARGKEIFHVTISWQGGSSWALVFSGFRGCLGWLFNRPPNKTILTEVKILLDHIVLADPRRFTNVKWIKGSEFAGIASAFVIPEGRQTKNWCRPKR